MIEAKADSHRISYGLTQKCPQSQIVTVPSGEEFVFLPRKEYEALIDALDDALEELADIVTCDRVKAELAEDPDGVLPADLSALTLIRSSPTTNHVFPAASIG